MTALVIIGAALPVLPVTLRNYLIGGEFISIASNGGVNFYIGNNSLANGIRAVVPGTRTTWKGGYEDTHNIPEMELGKKLKEAEISDYWYRKSFQWIRSDARAMVSPDAQKVLSFLENNGIAKQQAYLFLRPVFPDLCYLLGWIPPGGNIRSRSTCFFKT